MGSHDKIVALNYQVVHRGSWQIQFERPPIAAVVERNVNAILRTCVKKSVLLRIFADCPHKTAVGNAIGELCPALAVVAGLIHVGSKIIALMSINCYIGCGSIMRRGFDLADAAPLWQIFGSDI